MAKASAANDFVHEPGLTMEETAKRYSVWAQSAKYEKDLSEANYKGPVITADVIAKYFPDHNSRSNAYILDVAAGSGFVGEKLLQKGFKTLDALEPSEGMLNLARGKGIYKRTFQTFLNGTSSFIESDFYDVAVICGGMGEGHIPCSGLDELIRLVKPGGLVVIVMRENYLTSVAEYRDRLEPRMKEMEIDGKWTSVCRRIVPQYSFNNNGVVYVFKKQ